MLSATANIVADVQGTAQIDGNFEVWCHLTIFLHSQAGGPFALGVYYTNGGFGGIANENFNYNYNVDPLQASGALTIDLVLTPNININVLDGIFSVGIVPPFTLSAETDESLCLNYALYFEANATASIGYSILSDSWSDNIYPNTLLWSYNDPCASQ